jgi:DNA processing protein
MQNNSKLYEIAVGLIPGIGNMLTKQLVSYCGSAQEVFKKSRAGLKNIPNIGDILADQIINSDVLKLAEEELKKADKQGVKILFYTDPEYPTRLKQINDAPTLIYSKGNADMNNDKVIAIVGTREATAYGKEITDQIVKELISQNALIVSGLAYGIDIAAHKSAVKYGLPTIGVMASGIDIIYPAVHKSTAMEMIENGAVITENKFGTIPDAPRFPARNRIIAGMSDALIVVEASEKGGALITAEIANSYNKEVFAVPGRMGDKFSSGCNKLIHENKALLFNSVNNMLASLNWDGNKLPEPISKAVPDLEGTEKKVYEMLFENGEITIDELAWKTQLNVNKLSSVLLTLEFGGLVKALPGKKFKLSS